MKKLYILLTLAFIWFTGNAQIIYQSPLCTNSPNAMPTFVSNTPNGGTFTSSTGLQLNPVTGVIVPAGSIPGSYVVTYSVSADIANGIPAMQSTTYVEILPVAVPVFDPIPEFCFGANTFPVMPSVSNNGISGTWTSTVTLVLNTLTFNYEFTPNIECAALVSMTRIVIEPVEGFITTLTGSDTVYVDENNAVVAPLTLTNEILSDDYSYQWFENGAYIEDADSGTYTVTNASANGEDRIFTVRMRNVATGCSSMSNEFVVHQSSGTPPPTGGRSQTFSAGATLANMVVSGANIQWYTSAANKNAAALPLSTLLVDNTTYYASQTVNGSESTERLAVTAHVTLGIGESELVFVTYSPNPVKNRLTIKALNTIDNVAVINTLGQLLKTTTHHEAEIVEDMSGFTAGTYFIRVTSGSKTQVIKIVKE